MNPPESSLGVSVAGRYRLDHCLGQGNLGNVYAALDLESQRLVTIKLAHQVGDGQSSRSMAARFRRELELGQKLRHPAIVQPLDSGTFLGSPFLVCEHVEGVSVVEWFEQSGRNFEALAATLEAILEALQLAHDQRIVHRALKPGHILVDAQGRPKILDFGLSARLDDQLAAGSRSALDLAYLSPEQILGERGDGRSDLYALGAILYQLGAGVPPFQGKTVAQMLLCHLHQLPIPLSSLPRSLPNWLDRICRRLLLKQPGDRPTSAADVLALVRRRPSRAPAHPQVLLPLLGRDQELGQLEKAVQILHQGRGGCFWIWGEGGIGKSHLLQHLRRRSSAQEIEWVELRPQEARPLHWLDWVLHPGLRIYPEGPSLEAWSSQRPRVCVLRGFEASDDSLWTLLADWAEQARSRPLLLLLVSQQPPRQTFEPRLLGQIALKGLKREQCARLIEERIWSPPPPEAAAWFHRISQGNPLFLGLLLEKMEGSYLRVDGPSARWTAPPQQMESSLEIWLSRDLADLGPAHSELLGLAAVVGPRFSYNLVRSLYLGEDAQLEQSLDALVRLGWLQESFDGGLASHRFSHHCRWWAARTMLDRRRTRRLATLVGAFLEYPQSGEPDWARAADHYEMAQESRAYLRCLTQCLLLACESEDWALARAWMKRSQKPAGQVVDRIFPGPWYNFGWVGLQPASGPRHFLATLLAYQGRSDEADWYLQLSMEDDLEDDPPRWVENLLLRVVFHLRGWLESPRPLGEILQQAREAAARHGFDQGEALASALAMKLSPLRPATEAGTPREFQGLPTTGKKDEK